MNPFWLEFNFEQLMMISLVWISSYLKYEILLKGTCLANMGNPKYYYIKSCIDYLLVTYLIFSRYYTNTDFLKLALTISSTCIIWLLNMLFTEMSLLMLLLFTGKSLLMFMSAKTSLLWDHLSDIGLGERNAWRIRKHYNDSFGLCERNFDSVIEC